MSNAPTSGLGFGRDLNVPIGTSVHSVCDYLEPGIHTPQKVMDLGPSNLTSAMLSPSAARSPGLGLT